MCVCIGMFASERMIDVFTVVFVKVRPPRPKMVKMSSKTCFVFIAFSESSLLVLSTFV